MEKMAREARHSARCPVARPGRGAPALGDRRGAGLGELAEVLAGQVVRREALLRLARDQGLQDAHPRAAVAVPRVHAVRDLRRRAAQARCAAVEASAPSERSIHDLMLLPIERLRSFFATLELPAPLDEATDLLLTEIRDANRVSRRGGTELSHPRSPVAHALGRRGAANQSHDRARNVARQHAVRARRAVDRPASARHGPGDRRHEEAARRRQLARRRRARSADHVRGGSDPRHGTGAGRARRTDRVLWGARRAEARRIR